MPRGPRFALLALLVVAALAAAGVAGASAAGPPAQTDGTAGTAPGVENTTLLVRLEPDGDARWSVSATYNLTTDNETEAFLRLAEAYTAGDTASLGLPAFRAAAGAAGEATGRDMAIVDVERSAAPESVVRNGTGRLTLSFTWTNFARVEGDRLIVGDAFGTDGGSWLSGLDADQRLVVEPPDGYGVISASDGVPAPSNGTITWRGPTTFGEDGFAITFTGSGGGNGPPRSTPWPLLAVLALGVGAVVAYAALRRRGVGLPGPAPDGAGDGEVESGEVAADGAAAAGGAGDTATGGAAEGTGDAAADGEDGEGVDEELLSDEERVERLLERNGGRMKQANIVKETGWSNAKVSQLLSSMDEDGRIDKLRIGRENLISFPDEDITDLED